MTPVPRPAPRSPKPPRRITRTARPRKQRKSTVAALKRKLWALVSVYVRLRDFCCVTCPQPTAADQAGHFYSRSIASTWIDPKNLGAQCAKCNLQLHGNPGAFAEYIVRTYGPEELVRLTARARVVKQWKAPELEMLIEAIGVSGHSFESAYYESNL